MIKTVTIYDNSTDFGDRVRTLLATDDSVVNDEIIHSEDFKGFAEMSIKKSVPNWQDILSGDDGAKTEMLRSCVVLKTALLIAPLVKNTKVKVIQTTHDKVEYFENDYDALLEGLAERLSMFLMELNEEENITTGTLFGITNEKIRFEGAGFDVCQRSHYPVSDSCQTWRNYQI